MAGVRWEGGWVSNNHNVSNVKIDTYIMASRLIMTVLLVQAVSDSQALTYIIENFLNVMNTNSRTSTLVNIPLKQIPYIK